MSVLPGGAIALATALILGACSSVSRPPPADLAQVDALQMRGYLSETHRPVEEQTATLTLDSTWVGVRWTLPAQGNALPVVVYLPGLGGSSSDGAHWRRAWAAAGYAVLALDPDADDRATGNAPGAAAAAAGGTALEVHARLADQRDAFHDQARLRYQPEASAARLDRLLRVLTALRTRPPGDATLVRRLDLRRVVLAGYDIGAYTAMLAAGERPRADWARPALPVPLVAVIALSPYADFSGSGFAQRYRDIQVPVLSVSGSADEDSAGVVGSAYVRRAPFEHLSSPAALLWLKGADHVLLAGRTEPAVPMAADTADAPGTNHLHMTAGGPRSNTEIAIDVALVAGTTTAFLDAYLKGDPLALQWLARSAGAWVGKHGEWRQH